MDDDDEPHIYDEADFWVVDDDDEEEEDDEDDESEAAAEVEEEEEEVLGVHGSRTRSLHCFLRSLHSYYGAIRWPSGLHLRFELKKSE